jgi:hypothetical protein
VANLSDIVSAIDRLAEKLNQTPSTTPDVLVHEATPATGKDARSVQWEMKVMPYLSAMTKHLSGIYTLLARQSSNAASRAVLPIAQPLTPAPVQRSMQRIQAASIRGRGQSIDLMQILSGGLGGVPIAGTVLRHFGLLQTLLGGDESTPNTGTPSGVGSIRARNYRAWRDSMTPSPIAGSLMNAFKKFGPGVIGKRLSKSLDVLGNYSSQRAGILSNSDPRGMSEALGVLNKAAVGAAIDLGVVAGSVLAVGGAVIAFGKAISNANRAISGYSPVMAMAFALSDATDVFRGMASANNRAGAEAQFSASYSDFKNAARPLTDNFMRLFEDLATVLLKVITPVVSVLNWVIGKPLGVVVGAIENNRGPKDYMNDQTRELIKSGKLSPEDEKIARRNLEANGGSVVKGNSGITQAQQALKDAIAALKANTDALNKSGGGAGILASDFMMGVVGAHIGRFGGSQAAHAPIRVKNRRPAMRASQAPANTSHAIPNNVPLGGGGANDDEPPMALMDP